MERPKAVSWTRADQLRDEWRRIRRSWLVQLAKQSGYAEDRLSLLSQADRAFVQRCRLERVTC